MKKKIIFGFLLSFLAVNSFASNGELSDETVFTRAIIDRDFEQIQKLLAEGHVLTEHDVMSAALCNNLQFFKQYVTCNVSIDVIDCDLNMTPLMYAVFAGYEILVQELLECGARVDIVNKRGDCALRYATIHEKKHLQSTYAKIKSLLQEHGLRQMSESEFKLKQLKVAKSLQVENKEKSLPAKSQNVVRKVTFLS